VQGRVVAVQTVSTGIHYHDEVRLKDLAHVGWRHIDGFITIASAVQLDYLEALRDAGKPVVSVGSEEATFGCPAVLADNLSGARQAVEHLLAHGHRRVAFVGALGEFDIRERYEAYRSTLLEHGIEPDPSLVFEADNNLEHAAVPAGRALLAAGLPSTAVFAATDLTAVAIMRVLKEAGLQLPRDQAIVGFDDEPDGVMVSPSLSTVSQDIVRLGGLATELLLKQLSGAPVAAGRYVVPTSFVPRESCGCLRSSGPSAGPSTGSSRSRGPSADEGLVQELISTLGDPTPTRATRDNAQVARLASEICRTYAEAAIQTPTAGQLRNLGRVCAKLYSVIASLSAYDAILSLAAGLDAQLMQSLDEYPPGLTERLRLCTYEVRLTLSTTLLEVRDNAYFELRKMVRDEYKITIDLLHTADQDARSLDWLKNTDACAGVLGLWRDDEKSVPGGRAPARALQIAGTFDAANEPPVFGCQSVEVEDFPPETLFGLDEKDQIVCVFPLKSPTADWGFLAIAQPLVSFIEQEASFAWSALFSEALYQRELLRSLAERSDQLAISYKNEREMAQAVRESEERYALAVQAANDGLWDWDLNAGTFYCSPRLNEMLAVLSPGFEKPNEWFSCAHPEDRDDLLAEISDLKTGSCSSMTREFRVRSQDGGYLWVLCRARAVPGLGAPAKRIVGSVTDVTERKTLEERLRHQALYDKLTGLPNRELFLDRLSGAIASAKRQPDHAYAVLWIDLDNFKSVNDTLGHFYGDELLVQVAERVRAHVRETDTAARFGGDEFVLLLQGANESEAVELVVHRLSEHLNQPYVLHGHEVPVTASIGLAMGSSVYEWPDQILRDADTAMYSAKSTRRGSYVSF
jgi:diguanylate cyclase (GGDEF)-like protein/PAS domain S-box-containing protein